MESGREVYRILSRDAYIQLEPFLRSEACRRLVDAGLLIPTDMPDSLPDGMVTSGEVALRHPRVWIVNFPYEWTDAMLRDAAFCTLDVQTAVAEAGWSLKDASAFNVQFDVAAGLAPVFIDVASIEPLAAPAGPWPALRQFVSHFLLPLAMENAMDKDIREIFLTSLDGVDPEQTFHMLSPLRMISPPFLSLVTIPHLLGRIERRRRQADLRNAASDTDRARFVRARFVDILRSQVRRLARPIRSSAWEQYDQINVYPPPARAEKEQFIHDVCVRVAPQTVLDLGCNTGAFSVLAARGGARVCAIDADMASLDVVYRTARAQHLPILPLRVDITNPSPALGWRNRERDAFLSRAGRFDCVFALAILHHLLAGGIPLAEIAALLDALTRRYVVAELIDAEDPMFLELVRGRDRLYSHLSIGHQREVLSAHFTVADRRPLSGMNREMVLLEQRT